MKVGLMGGTFNPIHMGHLIISEYIRTILPLDRIVFIPSGNPPHKFGRELLSPEHRQHMVSLAIESNPFFDISSIEIDREGNSFTIDTIRELKNMNPDNDFYFIIGADSLFELTTWKDYKDLFKITNFIVMGRPDYSDDEILLKIEELNKLFGSNILKINGPLIEISSSTIRNRINNSKTIKYLVPEAIEEYIHINKLYQGG